MHGQGATKQLAGEPDPQPFSRRWPLLAGLLAAICLAALAAPPSALAALHVIPFPGTPDASPLSQVIFSSLQPAAIRSVTVIGSSSGPHPGSLAQLPDGAGTAFTPRAPFTPGERVNVVATLGSKADGAASGDPGSSVLTFSFTIEITTSWTASDVPGPNRRAPSSEPSPQAPSSEPTQSFRSQPGLHPPGITATSDPDTKSGDIFLTPVPSDYGSMQAGPMILNSRGQLVWFRRVPGWATNLEVQRYHGDPALTWWQRGLAGANEEVIVGRSYRTIAVLHAGYGYAADIHEFQLTPQGTALIDAYAPVQADLSSVGGSTKGSVMDCVIQELDVKTGRVLWEWHALGHVPLDATFIRPPQAGTPYDFFHLNSIQQLPNGNLLVSSRSTWSVYEIDKQTGSVVWRIGGRSSNFKIGPGAEFKYQHDARLLPGGILTVFDDGSYSQSQSSGKVIKLNTVDMTASLVHRYQHSPPLLSGAEGSTQLLPNKDVFVGWGTQPEFSEYAPGGKQIFAGSLPLGVRSYRAFRFPWSAQPASPPAMAVAPQANGALKVYASWNGDTHVAAWRVLAGPRRNDLRRVLQAGKTGFETVITLHGHPRYVAVAALSAQGKVLGTSRVNLVGH